MFKNNSIKPHAYPPVWSSDLRFRSRVLSEMGANEIPSPETRAGTAQAQRAQSHGWPCWLCLCWVKEGTDRCHVCAATEWGQTVYTQASALCPHAPSLFCTSNSTGQELGNTNNLLYARSTSDIGKYSSVLTSLHFLSLFPTAVISLFWIFKLC